ncbi:unnamed protein product [Haemonchus placei]|uniref:Transducin/WD40 repeat-like superfamily protein n=1 Tax=Haemonchus placei TaxID=6290 RepID=A0A0N4W5G8_HAEPC|nr:unnamed protein product [Haemonchus placei]
MDGDDVIMSSVEESPCKLYDLKTSPNVYIFSVGLLYKNKSLFQQILLSSPAHLFSCGLLSADQLSTSWEQWLCYLASSLTPHQWQVCGSNFCGAKSGTKSSSVYSHGNDTRKWDPLPKVLQLDLSITRSLVHAMDFRPVYIDLTAFHLVRRAV